MENLINTLEGSNSDPSSPDSDVSPELHIDEHDSDTIKNNSTFKGEKNMWKI